MNGFSGLAGFVLMSLVFNDLLGLAHTITTTHYNKPHDIGTTKITPEVKKQEEHYFNVTLPASERQKRLLPYMNFYMRHNFNQPYHRQPQPPQPQQDINPPRYTVLIAKQNPLQLTGVNIQPQVLRQQQVKVKYTPFTETNALPGPFLPMKTEQQYRVGNQPNFGEIYDKLLQLKYAQQNQQPQHANYEPQFINYIAVKRPQQQSFGQPTKTTIHRYNPSQIDVPPPPTQYHHETYQQNYQQPIQVIEVVENRPKQLVQDLIRKPVIILRQKPYEVSGNIDQNTEEEKQRIFQEQLRIYEDQQQAYRNEQRLLEERERMRLDEEERRKHLQEVARYPVYTQQNLQNHQYQDYQPKYQVIPMENLQAPTQVSTTELPLPTQQLFHQVYPVTESPNTLAEILRKLQASNTLPQNLTPENVDNSIKTLIKILNLLKKHQKLSRKPIVVPDQEEEVVENEAGMEFMEQLPENFPEDTNEGGTPGKPGVDYPALSSIPQTTFSCKTQRYKGFFGDPDTNCQVWHYCDFNGGQASFLCPNGTIFSQVALTCDWWFNVKCSSTAQLYVLNERLYKYILPFSPKFPEDYSGPLVDRYLALKFQEMEEKMKNQRKKGKESQADEQKGEGQKDDLDQEKSSEGTEDQEDDDADQLQRKNEENRKNASRIYEAVYLEGNNVERRSIS